MRIPLFLTLAVMLALTSCKDKLEKKDKTLTEMQEDEGGKPENYMPVLESADATPVYKKIGDSVEMHLNVYFPDKLKKNAQYPAIIYFFGGAFIHGSPAQFEEHCKYFAGRGMVAISADYRVISRNGGNGLTCIYDAKSAIRYLREHAGELHIDPNKIVVAGGSAGGFLAISCAINDPKWQDPTDNIAISSQPNAMVLLNPVVNAMEHKFRIEKFKDSVNQAMTDSHAGEVNPLTSIKGGMPPAIIFHGTADKISAIQFVQQFCDAYKAAGNQCELHTYEGQKHGFTALKFKAGKYYRDALIKTDVFLKSLGYLTGEPTITE